MVEYDNVLIYFALSTPRCQQVIQQSSDAPPRSKAAKDDEPVHRDLKIAKALGLTIAQSVLIHADEVIQ